jgi:DNA-binding MarR family transcriptional regulator
VTEVHHQGKFRGPDFAPIHFILESTTSEKLKDSKGNLIWTVFAKPASEEDQENISRAVEADLAAIMRAIADDPTLSMIGIARALGWRDAHKSKVQRRMKTLERKKWVERDGDRLELTAKGKTQLAKIEGRMKEAAPQDGP